MKKIIKYTFLFSMFVLPFWMANSALAQSSQVQPGLDVLKNSFPTGAAQTSNLSELIRTIINWSLYFSAILAVIYIIIGGYTYIMAGGDENAAKKGRVALTNAIIGLVMIVFSYALVQVVYNFLINQR